MEREEVRKKNDVAAFKLNLALRRVTCSPTWSLSYPQGMGKRKGWSKCPCPWVFWVNWNFASKHVKCCRKGASVGDSQPLSCGLSWAYIVAKLLTDLRVPAPSSLLTVLTLLSGKQGKGPKTRWPGHSYRTGLLQDKQLYQSLMNPCPFSWVRATLVAHSDLSPTTNQLIWACCKRDMNHQGLKVTFLILPTVTNWNLTSKHC